MKLKWWLAGIGYLALAIIMTWPLVLNISTHIMGTGGDAPMFVWDAWWLKKVIFEGQNLFSTDYMFWPQTIDLSLHTLTLVNSTVIAILSKVINLVAAFNIYFLISISLSGLFTFLLVRYITKSDLPAFVSGIIFAFSPYITMHWLGHQNLVTIWFIPLFILLIFKLLKEKKWIYAISAGIIAGLASLNDFYNPIFLIGFLLLLIIWIIIAKKITLKLLWQFLSLVFIWLIIWSIWWIPAIATLFNSEISNAMSLEQITAFYGADPLRYFTPSFLNPIFGWLASEIPGRFSGGVEGTIFLGYLPVLTVLGFMVYKIRNKIKEQFLFGTGFWIVLGLIFGILSLGPYLKIAERIIYISLPYAWIYQIIPLWDNFRVPARFSLMVVLAVAVLVGIALTHLLAKIRTDRFKKILIWIFCGIIILEFMPAPYPIMDLSIPVVYQQIKSDQNINSLLEIPWGINSGYWDEGRFESRFMFYQTYHNKKVAIGSVSRAKTEYFEFFPEDQIPFALPKNSLRESNFGTKWKTDSVLIHKNYLTQLDLENYSKYFTKLGFNKIYEDNLNIAFSFHLNNTGSLTSVEK